VYSTCGCRGDIVAAGEPDDDDDVADNDYVPHADEHDHDSGDEGTGSGSSHEAESEEPRKRKAHRRPRASRQVFPVDWIAGVKEVRVPCARGRRPAARDLTAAARAQLLATFADYPDMASVRIAGTGLNARARASRVRG
jgi:hypothetical protein